MQRVLQDVARFRDEGVGDIHILLEVSNFHRDELLRLGKVPLTLYRRLVVGNRPLRDSNDSGGL